jgi:hypothetical protein
MKGKCMSDMISLVYATMLPGLKKIAEKHGYALSIHGSMLRDFDLVAIPWTHECSPGADLIKAIADALSCYQGGPVTGPEQKPHDRQAWIIPLGAGLALDISVMPRVDPGESLFTFSCQCEKKYTIEVHGDGFVLYYGRCPHEHGYNLATIMESAPDFRTKLVDALNKADGIK